jgi:shikimate dehydrogenase
MRQTGARTIKIAVTAARLTDTLPLLAVGRDGGAIVIGMGGPGLATRLLASRFGSVWTYAGNGHALGQVPAWEMVHRFRFRRIGCGTAIYGVVSRTARHSLSPALHNAAFEAAGMDAVYLPLEAADFDDFLTFADALGLAGASVTIPFKVDALRAAAAADRTASAVGAANTLRRAPTGWEATNTDVDGFLEPLDAVWPGGLAGVRVSVLGAGGAARAVVVALVARGAAVSVHARRDMQARALAALGARVGSWPPEPRGWDLLVNATSVGGAAARDDSPLPGGPFDGRLVYDLTYGPGTSRLLREAQAAGCRTLDGLPMLVAQAERQFEWWTGRRPAAGVMAAAVAH